jgi:hypothetical protein
MQLTTNRFSRNDFQNAVGYSVVSYTKVKAVWSVVYVVDGRKCCKFVSVSQLLKAKFSAMVERSKEVQFTFISHTFAKTSNGHITSLSGCDCPALLGAYGLQVNNKPVCKHMIAYSKAQFNAQNLTQFITLVA